MHDVPPLLCTLWPNNCLSYLIYPRFPCFRKNVIIITSMHMHYERSSRQGKQSIERSLMPLKLGPTSVPRQVPRNSMTLVTCTCSAFEFTRVSDCSALGESPAQQRSHSTNPSPSNLTYERCFLSTEPVSSLSFLGIMSYQALG
jgi:hypothetical protein